MLTGTYLICSYVSLDRLDTFSFASVGFSHLSYILYRPTPKQANTAQILNHRSNQSSNLSLSQDFKTLSISVFPNFSQVKFSKTVFPNSFRVTFIVILLQFL